MFKFELGQELHDEETKVTGTVASRTVDGGVNRYALDPVGKGEVADLRWVAEESLSSPQARRKKEAKSEGEV